MRGKDLSLPYLCDEFLADKLRSKRAKSYSLARAATIKLGYKIAKIVFFGKICAV